MVVIEKGLEDKVEFVQVNPLENPRALLAVNPLGTVPALVTDTGMAICDSTVICEYLDGLSAKHPLFPTNPLPRFQALGLAALADGVMDAAVHCVIEGRKPEQQRSPEWIARKESAIKRTLALLAPHASGSEPLSIGTINLAVALAYVSFRLPHIDWRATHPQLAEWLDAFSERISMVKTKPVA